MGRRNSYYGQGKRAVRLALWAIMLMLIFAIFGSIIVWLVSPGSDEKIRQILKLPVTATPMPTPTEAPSPTPSSTPLPTPIPVLGTIIIDPGRGGEEKTPVTNTDKTVYEKDINLEISLLLKEKLEVRGYAVIMTRTEDVEVSQKERAELANNSNADIFISIHMNNLPSDTSVHGLDILYGKDRSDSKDLADYLITPTVSCGAKNRGVKSSSSYTVLSNVNIPSVLIELGFISNAEDVENLSKFTYKDTLVRGICEGIDKYFEYKKK